MKKSFHPRLYLTLFSCLFIFLSAALPIVGLSKKVDVYDVKTRRLISETQVSASPKVLTLSGDNRRAFLTNPDDASVSVIDIVNGKKLSVFQTGKKPDGIGWAN